jgi:hypothetical protein
MAFTHRKAHRLRRDACPFHMPRTPSFPVRPDGRNPTRKAPQQCHKRSPGQRPDPLSSLTVIHQSSTGLPLVPNHAPFGRHAGLLAAHEARLAATPNSFQPGVGNTRSRDSTPDSIAMAEPLSIDPPVHGTRLTVPPGNATQAPRSTHSGRPRRCASARPMAQGSLTAVPLTATIIMPLVSPRTS